MEAAAAVPGVAATRSGGGSSLPMPSPRKEWRAISDHPHPHHHNHQPMRNPVDNPEERPKLGHSAERTIYEVQHGREPIDVDFCSITVDGSQDNDILQQRVQSIAREREQLLLLEVELRAQMIARSEIMDLQNRFDAQLKEHAEAAVKLQEQLHAKEQTIHDLERRMEEKDRELHAIKLDNEAAWAKDDLLREQNKELATFRQRERDHSEAERAQHIQQICDLQEHIQDKERQILELQEQHRVAQETIYGKDEQLKVWISRAQEMDALQSTASHSLQAELRERTEQYNQLWLGCQRQFTEMERLHLHAMQQLQLELADARERSGSYSDESRVTQTNSNDLSKLIYNNGNQLEANGSNGTSSNNGAISPVNGNNTSSFSTTGNASSQNNHVTGVPFPPSSLLGMPAYLPPGQVAALHPYILHQQGISHSMPSHASQSHAGHFPSIQAMASFPQWHNQQALSENAQFSNQNQLEQPQTDQNLSRSEGKYEFEMTINGHGFNPNYTNVHISHELEPDPMPTSSAGEQQVQQNEAVESIDQSFLVASSMDHGIQQISSQVASSLNLNSFEHNSETKELHVLNASDEGLEGQSFAEEELSTVASASLSEMSVHSVNLTEVAINNGSGVIVSDAYVSSGQPNLVTAAKNSEPSLLDERSLLACIVRTIPAGGRIRINSTLPNRLGKMLAPLHWHDYKKKFGRLDDFVAGHPELFLVEGDYIQLREGAQENIAAKAAVAKVAAAAAAALSPYSSFMPSVAVTPMAQSHRLKKVPSVDSKLQNGPSFAATGSVSNVKILSKSKDSQQGRTTAAALTSRT